MNKYEIILKAYETGNITKTAESLNYTQSAVSQAINNYEKELGFAIFIRSKSGVSPTADGLRIIDSIKRIIKEEERIEEISSSVSGLHSGTIRVGAFTSVSILWLPKFMKEFNELYPNIQFELISGNYNDLITLLKKGDLNCSFLSSTTARDFCFTPLYKDEYMVICPMDHPFSRMACVPLKLLNAETFIMPGEGLDADLGAIFSENRIHPHHKYLSSDDAASLAMVETGLGITLLPRLVVDSVSNHVCSRPLKEHYYRSLGIAVRDEKYASKATLKFIDFVRKQALELP